MCPAWPGGSSAVDTVDRGGGGGLEVQILWSNSRLVKEKYSVKIHTGTFEIYVCTRNELA